MSFFDRFRKKKEEPKPADAAPQYYLPRVSYTVAYYLLPHFVFHDCENLIKRCVETPESAGAFHYLMACRHHRFEPVKEDALRFRFHQGQLDDSDDFYALEYPVPPPLNEDADRMKPAGIKGLLLAPHFSVVLRHRETVGVKYYVLGQAPLSGGTTLRSLTANGVNSNHGPGPEPQLDAMLSVLRTSRGKLPTVALHTRPKVKG